MTTTGKQYKQLKLDGKVGEKDMVNVFAGTPHYALNIGDEIDDSLLYINDKGYLSLNDRKVAPQAPQPTPQGLEVKIGFLAQSVKELHEKADRILKHIGAQTAVEEAYSTPVGDSFEDSGIDQITDDQIPF